MRDSPSLNRNSNVIRALSAGFGLAILLTGCATTAPAPKLSIGPTASWTAAIGELDTGGDGPHCTAVLVAPDIIASAAHCQPFLTRRCRPLTRRCGIWSGGVSGSLF